MHSGGSAGEPVPGDVSSLLRAWSDRDQRALAQLAPIVYEELRRRAHYLRLVDYQRMRWQTRAHFFGGLSVDETAEVLHVSSITVMREWKTAKAWLYRELTGGNVNGSRTLEPRR